jgi:hypothetical protein
MADPRKIKRSAQEPHAGSRTWGAVAHAGAAQPRPNQLGGHLGIRPVIPSDVERREPALCSPHMVADDRHQIIQHHDLAHPGNRSSSTIIDMRDRTTEHGACREGCELHSRRQDVDGVRGLAARATRTSIRRMGEQGLAARQKSPAQERRAGQIGALGLGGKIAKQTNSSRAGLLPFPSPPSPKATIRRSKASPSPSPRNSSSRQSPCASGSKSLGCCTARCRFSGFCPMTREPFF